MLLQGFYEVADLMKLIEVKFLIYDLFPGRDGVLKCDRSNQEPADSWSEREP
jgi:hypothetical protein